MRKIADFCRIIFVTLMLLLFSFTVVAAGYGVKDKVAGTGRKLGRAATKVKEKTGAGYKKTKGAGRVAVGKTKGAARGVGSMTAHGARAVGHGMKRTKETFMGRNDSEIQSDVRSLLKGDSKTQEWVSQVKSGMVTVRTTNQHDADVGAVISDIRKIDGVRSVFVVAE